MIINLFAGPKDRPANNYLDRALARLIYEVIMRGAMHVGKRMAYNYEDYLTNLHKALEFGGTQATALIIVTGTTRDPFLLRQGQVHGLPFMHGGSDGVRRRLGVVFGLGGRRLRSRHHRHLSVRLHTF